jgi:hypothetical protein
MHNWRLKENMACNVDARMRQRHKDSLPSDTAHTVPYHPHSAHPKTDQLPNQPTHKVKQEKQGPWEASGKRQESVRKATGKRRDQESTGQGSVAEAKRTRENTD